MTALWFDSSWGYYQQIEVKNNSKVNLRNYQVKIEIDSTWSEFWDKVDPSGNDIRIVSEDNKTKYPYWVEKFDYANKTAVIWAVIDKIPTKPLRLKIYYGNSSAINESNGSKVFDFFDDFDVFDTTVWSKSDAGANVSVSSGVLTIQNGAIFTINTPISFGNYVIEASIKPLSSGGTTKLGGIAVSDAQSIQAGNAGQNKTAMMQYDEFTATWNGWASDGTTNSFNITDNMPQGSATLTDFDVVGLSIDQFARTKFYLNRTETDNYNQSWQGNGYLILGSYLGSGAGTTDISDLEVDWVLVRKKAEVEPTITKIGTPVFRRDVAPKAGLEHEIVYEDTTSFKFVEDKFDKIIIKSIRVDNLEDFQIEAGIKINSIDVRVLQIRPKQFKSFEDLIIDRGTPIEYLSSGRTKVTIKMLRFE